MRSMIDNHHDGEHRTVFQQASEPLSNLEVRPLCSQSEKTHDRDAYSEAYPVLMPTPMTPPQEAVVIWFHRLTPEWQDIDHENLSSADATALSYLIYMNLVEGRVHGRLTHLVHGSTVDLEVTAIGTYKPALEKQFIKLQDRLTPDGDRWHGAEIGITAARLTASGHEEKRMSQGEPIVLLHMVGSPDTVFDSAAGHSYGKIPGHVEMVTPLDELIRQFKNSAPSPAALVNEAAPAARAVSVEETTPPEKRPWTKVELETTLTTWLRKQEAQIAKLQKAIEAGDATARKQAKARFNSKAIAERFGVRSSATVRDTQAWDILSIRLRLRRKGVQPLARRGRIGFGKAVESESIRQYKHAQATDNDAEANQLLRDAGEDDLVDFDHRR